MEGNKPTIDAVAEAEKVKALEAVVETLTTENDQLRAGAKQKTLPEAKIGKDTYQFTVGAFVLDGRRYSAEEACADKKLCEKLLAIGFGGWKQVV